MTQIGGRAERELLQALSGEAISPHPLFSSIDWRSVFIFFVMVGSGLAAGGFASCFCLNAILAVATWVRAMAGVLIGVSLGIFALIVLLIFHRLISRGEGSQRPFYSGVIFYYFPVILFLSVALGLSGAIALSDPETYSLEIVLPTAIWMRVFLGAFVGSTGGSLALMICLATTNFRAGGLGASLFYDSPVALLFGGALGTVSGAIAGAISSQF
jgi:hypothetical protein